MKPKPAPLPRTKDEEKPIVAFIRFRLYELMADKESSSMYKWAKHAEIIYLCPTSVKVLFASKANNDSGNSFDEYKNMVFDLESDGFDWDTLPFNILQFFVDNAYARVCKKASYSDMANEKFYIFEPGDGLKDPLNLPYGDIDSRVKKDISLHITDIMKLAKESEYWFDYESDGQYVGKPRVQWEAENYHEL